MKKTLLVLSTILAMSLVFVGCGKDPKEPGESAPVVPEETPEVPEETPDVKEDLVIFDTAQTFTTAGYGAQYNFPSDIDLNGYKYIKVELSSENAAGNKVVVQFFEVNGEEWVKCGAVESTALDSNVVTLYTECGTNFWEDTDYNGTGDKQSTATTLKLFQIYAQQTVSPWGTVDGVNVAIDKITLTNTK